MSRKQISDQVQKNVLMKSRRRCCCCFWLEGKDDVQQGQIAHLDQDNENNSESNLVFLCFNHHDQYDGKTRQSKGLLESEVRDYRDQLYQELEDRNRNRREYKFSLRQVRPIYVPDSQMCFQLKLTNLSTVSVRSPVVAIQLVEGIKGAKPKKSIQHPVSGIGLFTLPDYSALNDINGAHEEREDFFELNGRVAVKTVAGAIGMLHSGHSALFEALGCIFGAFEPGQVFDLKYRVDAESMPSFQDVFQIKMPERPEDFFGQ